jgi:hypothetical protein
VTGEDGAGLGGTGAGPTNGMMAAASRPDDSDRATWGREMLGTRMTARGRAAHDRTAVIVTRFKVELGAWNCWARGEGIRAPV